MTQIPYTFGITNHSFFVHSSWQVIKSGAPFQNPQSILFVLCITPLDTYFITVYHVHMHLMERVRLAYVPTLLAAIDPP